MTTAVISDVHMGKTGGRDLLRRPELRTRLFDRLADADRLVLLGDIVELREGPLARQLSAAQPFFEELGEAFAGKPVTLLSGNHDHQLAGPLLDAVALDGEARPLAAATEHRPEPGSGTPTGRVAAWLEKTDLTLSYPGAWLRDDVYATHGHYMDWHGTVPTIEVLLIGLTQRVVAHANRSRTTMTPGEYEAALAPVYELAYSLAQSAGPTKQLAGGGKSVSMWERINGMNGGVRARVEATVANKAAIPLAVAALNKLGLGPFRPDVTAVELRRAGLRSMTAVVTALGIDAKHVIFGHTHRSGPWPRDTEGWDLPGGGRLWNSGCWVHEPAFLGDDPLESPYFPGVIVWLDDEPGTPPRLERLLEPQDLP